MSEDMLTSSAQTARADHLVWICASAFGGAMIFGALPLYLVNQTSVDLYTLLPSVVLSGVCLAMIFSERGIRHNLASPLVIVASIYLICLGLPSMVFALTPLGQRNLFLGMEYVPLVDFYALGVLSLFYFGFTLAELVNRESRGRTVPGRPPRVGRIHVESASAPTQHSQPEMAANLLCMIAFASLACFYLSLASQGLLNGDVLRGAGQFNSWNWLEYMMLLGKAGLTMCTLTAGILWARHPLRRLWLVPVASFFMGATTDSRAVALPFLLFLVPSTLMRRAVSGGRLILVAVLCVLSATYLLEVRPSHMGLSGFFKAVGQGANQTERSGLLGGVSSLEYTTGPFWVSKNAKPQHAIVEVWRLVEPLPSFIVKQNLFVTNMMPYLGVYGGNTGAPFPLLGELYFFFGWWGIGFAFPSGFLLSVAFRRCETALKSAREENLLWPLLYMGFVAGVVDSMHSGLRTITRYPVWAILWSIIFISVVRRIDNMQRTALSPRANYLQ